MPNVLIGIPSGEMVHADFAMCLSRLLGFSGYNSDRCHVTAGLMNAKGCNVDRNCYQLAQEAVKSKFDYLMIIGTDHTFPPDTLHRMLDRDKDILALNLPKKTPPHSGVCVNEKGPLSGGLRGVQEVTLAGSGIMLIATEVFENLAPPWFECKFVGAGKFDSGDYSFCRQARGAGFKVWCDCDLSKACGHIGSKTHYIGRNS